MKFYKVKVAEIFKETKDSVSIKFSLPSDHPMRHFTPGQYLTLRYYLFEEKFQRCYSYSSLPTDELISISVKKTKHGFISKELVDKLKVGDELECGDPLGKFKVPEFSGQRRSHYFFAAGSGITPIYSMITSILENEPNANVYLLYSNKKIEDIIFHKKLIELEKKYEGQIKINFTLTAKNKGFFYKLFGLKNLNWTGWTGRIDEPMINRFLNEVHDTNRNKEYYICGPGKFIQKIIHIFEQKNIESDKIHKEYFSVDTSQVIDQKLDPALLPSTQLTFKLNGRSETIQTLAGEKILDALLRLGYDSPYSCSSGVCGSCVATKINGEIKMDSSLALDEEEIQNGFILTCQARCLSDQVEIKF
ncbi:MAG: 2Fe-2S iron-sulfur cluster binding domain-containing protein [Saprospiraceae bacterium]|nr:2Fe-2S iron-sulfur cluster binding domain-containing protein [Saprospiraceae bacterium]